MTKLIIVNNSLKASSPLARFESFQTLEYLGVREHTLSNKFTQYLEITSAFFNQRCPWITCWYAKSWRKRKHKHPDADIMAKSFSSTATRRVETNRYFGRERFCSRRTWAEIIVTLENVLTFRREQDPPKGGLSFSISPMGFCQTQRRWKFRWKAWYYENFV